VTRAKVEHVDAVAEVLEPELGPHLGEALARLAEFANGRPAVRRRLVERAPVEVVLAQDEQFTAAYAEFLRTHGCRALRYEAAEQNLDERPHLVLGLVVDQLAAGFDPDRTGATLAARRERAACHGAGTYQNSPTGSLVRRLFRARVLDTPGGRRAAMDGGVSQSSDSETLAGWVMKTWATPPPGGGIITGPRQPQTFGGSTRLSTSWRGQTG